MLGADLNLGASCFGKADVLEDVWPFGKDRRQRRKDTSEGLEHQRAKLCPQDLTQSVLFCTETPDTPVICFMIY